MLLEEDPSLGKTKEYTWMLVSLRQLRNLLARVIATLTSFEANHSIYFDLESEGLLYDRFRECFNQIRQSAAELATARMVLEQRIETLEKISDVVKRPCDLLYSIGSSLTNIKLVNASSLAESITASRQGDNIRLLTYISIVGFS